MADREGSGVSRRRLLVGGAAGTGLIVAWALWPRSYRTTLQTAPGETAFGAWLKIGADGQVTVAVPQLEAGQGVYTALPQIVADELGADWRTVAVEPAPIGALYANALAAGILFQDALGTLPDGMRQDHARRTGLLLTGASTSIRAFEVPLRDAGAAARILLCKAAARRWGGDWRQCGTADGFVVLGDRRERFGPLAQDAAGESVPAGILPYRGGEEKRLTGVAVPRLDAPPKVDGSAIYAGDVRLPDMVFASIRQGPIGTDGRLVRVDRAAADVVPGMLSVVEHPRWVAAVANNWWAANRALDALSPRFETKGAVDSAGIDAALDAAFDGAGTRIASSGDVAAAFRGAQIVSAAYRVAPTLHAAIEPVSATAAWRDGVLTLWMASQAPTLARAAAARAIGIDAGQVVLHQMLAGGAFGAKLEHDVAEQAAILAQKLKRPVQVTWSRSETSLHDRCRPPAAARLSARLGAGGSIAGWLAKIATPATGHKLSRRLLGGDTAASLGMRMPGRGVADRLATEGAVPPYGIGALAVDHHPADITLPTGYWRSGAASYTAFFNESFIDELAHVARVEAHSFRIAMLGGDIRMARCLSTVAALGGWQGGVPGSAQGIACHRMRGSYIALLAEAHVGRDQRVRVDRLVAAVDCGRQINPDLVLQQIEGGLIFGMAAALGASTGYTSGLADTRHFRDMRLPQLATTPEITVELIASDADPGGVSEIAVPAVAPAIANALVAATGVRLRRLPLVPGQA